MICCRRSAVPACLLLAIAAAISPAVKQETQQPGAHEAGPSTQPKQPWELTLAGEDVSNDCPHEHPYFWVPFVLIGGAD